MLTCKKYRVLVQGSVVDTLHALKTNDHASGFMQEILAAQFRGTAQNFHCACTIVDTLSTLSCMRLTWERIPED